MRESEPDAPMSRGFWAEATTVTNASSRTLLGLIVLIGLARNVGSSASGVSASGKRLHFAHPSGRSMSAEPRAGGRLTASALRSLPHG